MTLGGLGWRVIQVASGQRVHVSDPFQYRLCFNTDAQAIERHDLKGGAAWRALVAPTLLKNQCLSPTVIGFIAFAALCPNGHVLTVFQTPLDENVQDGLIVIRQGITVGDLFTVVFNTKHPGL